MSVHALVSNVVELVAAELCINPKLIYSKDRHGSVALGRNLCCLAVRDGTAFSFVEIGAALGARDHTTIISNVRRARGIVERDARAAAIVERAKALISRSESEQRNQSVLLQQYARLGAIDTEIARLMAQRSRIQRVINEERILLGLAVSPTSPAEGAVAAE